MASILSLLDTPEPPHMTMKARQGTKPLNELNSQLDAILSAPALDGRYCELSRAANAVGESASCRFYFRPGSPPVFDQDRRIMIHNGLSADTDPKTRRSIVTGLFERGDAKSLIDLARKETDTSMKSFIVQDIGHMAQRNKEAADYLIELRPRKRGGGVIVEGSRRPVQSPTP